MSCIACQGAGRRKLLRSMSWVLAYPPPASTITTYLCTLSVDGLDNGTLSAIHDCLGHAQWMSAYSWEPVSASLLYSKLPTSRSWVLKNRVFREIASFYQCSTGNEVNKAVGIELENNIPYFSWKLKVSPHRKSVLTDRRRQLHAFRLTENVWVWLDYKGRSSACRELIVPSTHSSRGRVTSVRSLCTGIIFARDDFASIMAQR
ncbi:hypothetical protein CIHG_02327 [Coccidioides immitis H538.4]|uniref:Uncharacterized protein n=1 Tax=Coccidioides immitis H538.4 TaxID=396776 RepID=A0A0J8UBP6_COCIT|nr:hypothetical protein CIHG_02327 [Coccidioides immitis H538.4]